MFFYPPETVHIDCSVGCHRSVRRIHSENRPPDYFPVSLSEREQVRSCETRPLFPDDFVQPPVNYFQNSLTTMCKGFSEKTLFLVTFKANFSSGIFEQFSASIVNCHELGRRNSTKNRFIPELLFGNKACNSTRYAHRCAFT